MWSLEEYEAVCTSARKHGASIFTDGARLLNAVAVTGVPVDIWAAPVDAIWIDFSKGVGASGGAVIGGGGVHQRRQALQVSLRRYDASVGSTRRRRPIRARTQRSAHAREPRTRPIAGGGSRRGRTRRRRTGVQHGVLLGTTSPGKSEVRRSNGGRRRPSQLGGRADPDGHPRGRHRRRHECGDPGRGAGSRSGVDRSRITRRPVPDTRHSSGRESGVSTTIRLGADMYADLLQQNRVWIGCHAQGAQDAYSPEAAVSPSTGLPPQSTSAASKSWPPNATLS